MPEFFHSAVDGAILACLPASMPGLVEPSPNAGLAGEMARLLKVVDGLSVAGPMRKCLRAGLWVLADDLDRAHTICQAVETPHGAAWHAVVHRREGDFWNSKYWWHRAEGVAFAGLWPAVERHVPQPPTELSGLFRGGRYEPAAFAGLVERRGRDKQLADALVMLQRLEWLTLFAECIT